MNRVRSVDVLRGFALMCMVLIHFMIYFGNDAAIATWPYFILNHLLGDWGAAGFLMMMGISQVLSAARTPDAGALFLFKKAAVRAVYLFAIGLLMLALAWGPGHIWQWDILTLMGFATLVLYFCRFLPSWLILGLSAAIAVVTPWLRTWVDPAANWGGKFVPVPILSDYFPGLLVDPAGESQLLWQWDVIVQGFLLTGEFPVFPWVLFPMIGLVLGRRIVAQLFPHDLPFLLIIGFLLAWLGLGGAFASLAYPGASASTDYFAPLSFYPDSFTMLLVQSGLALIVFSTLYSWYDVRRRDEQKVGLLTSLYNRTSRFSLTFYFLHYLLIGWTLALVYAMTGEYLIFALMGAWPALLCGLVALIFLETLLLFWERHGGRYSLEWILVLLTNRVVGSGTRMNADR
jgi:uncharacterized membrane protein